MWCSSFKPPQQLYQNNSRRIWPTCVRCVWGLILTVWWHIFQTVKGSKCYRSRVASLEKRPQSVWNIWQSVVWKGHNVAVTTDLWLLTINDEPHNVSCMYVGQTVKENLWRCFKKWEGQATRKQSTWDQFFFSWCKLTGKSFRSLVPATWHCSYAVWNILLNHISHIKLAAEPGALPLGRVLEERRSETRISTNVT